METCVSIVSDGDYVPWLVIVASRRTVRVVQAANLCGLIPSIKRAPADNRIGKHQICEEIQPFILVIAEVAIHIWPAVVPDLVGVRLVAGRLGVHRPCGVECHRVDGHSIGELFHIAHAHDNLGAPLGPVEGGEQHRREDGDDSNDEQKFYEREAAFLLHQVPL